MFHAFPLYPKNAIYPIYVTARKASLNNPRIDQSI
jgi:hypothetical protein